MRHTVASPRGATLAGTRLVTQESHNVRCHVCPRLQRSPIIYQVCLPSDALPARCTRLPAATHAVHAGPLGLYDCHTILYTALPPKVLAAFSTPSKSSSYSHNHHLHGSSAVGACAAQALLSLPQTAHASTCTRPPCAPSRAAIPTTPHTPATARAPTRRHVARVYVSTPHNLSCLLPRPPCPRRVSLDITRSPAFFQALSHRVHCTHRQARRHSLHMLCSHTTSNPTVTPPPTPPPPWHHHWAMPPPPPPLQQLMASSRGPSFS